MIPLDVLEAFGMQHDIYLLSGGQGTSWRCGDFVLKPHEDSKSYEGIAHMVNSIEPQDFRISRYHPTVHGTYSYKGWGCTRFESGTEVTGRITDKYAVARSLHDLFAKIEKPRDWHASVSPWSRAHQISWQKTPLPETCHPDIAAVIGNVFQYYSPLRLENQIIHGDLCGNILFDEVDGPLVIDFSLDYHPRAYAEAILIADSIAWENGGEEAYHLLPPDSEQVLLRACVFRLTTKALLLGEDFETFQVRSRGYRDIIKRLINA